MKLTKKLETLFKRYEVELRSEPTSVTHKMTGVKTACDPVIFAVFETLVKAEFATLRSGRRMREPLQQHGGRSWLDQIAVENDFNIHTEVSRTDSRTADQCQEDKRHCVQVITDAGLYHALLD